MGGGRYPRRGRSRPWIPRATVAKASQPDARRNNVYRFMVLYWPSGLEVRTGGKTYVRSDGVTILSSFAPRLIMNDGLLLDTGYVLTSATISCGLDDGGLSKSSFTYKVERFERCCFLTPFYGSNFEEILIAARRRHTRVINVDDVRDTNNPRRRARRRRKSGGDRHGRRDSGGGGRRARGRI